MHLLQSVTVDLQHPALSLPMLPDPHPVHFARFTLSHSLQSVTENLQHRKLTLRLYKDSHAVHLNLSVATQFVQWVSAAILQHALASVFRKILKLSTVTHAEHVLLLTAQAEQSAIMLLSQHLSLNNLYPVAHVTHLLRSLPSQSMQWSVPPMAQQYAMELGTNPASQPVQIAFFVISAAQFLHFSSAILQQLSLFTFKNTLIGGAAVQSEQVVGLEHVEQPKTAKLEEQHLSEFK